MSFSEKHKFDLLFLVSMVISCACFIVSCSGPAEPEEAQEEANESAEPSVSEKPPEEGMAFQGESSELERTVVVPAFESPMEEGKNTVWCSAFQVAWDKLGSEILGKPIRMAEASAAVELLNASRSKEADLHPDSYYANAGFVRDGIVETINKEMKEKFPDAELPEFGEDIDLIAYAYLATVIKFANPYAVKDEGLVFTDSAGDETPVKCFGVERDDVGAEAIRRQVGVLFYSYDEGIEEFAVDMDRESSPYQLVLAVVRPQQTLAATYDYVMQRAKEYSSHGRPYLRRSDELLVPEIWWKIFHEFTELENKKLLNEGFTGYWIDSATQMIYFKLDNKGVELKSEAKIEIKKNGGDNFRVHFNRPFLIYLKKRDAQTPIFAIWVDNAELLVKNE